MLGLPSPRLNDLQIPCRETANTVRLEYGTREVDSIVSMQVLPYAAEDERLSAAGVAGAVRAMPDEYAAIDTGGYPAAPSFEAAVGALRTRLDLAAGASPVREA